LWWLAAASSESERRMVSLGRVLALQTAGGRQRALQERLYDCVTIEAHERKEKRKDLERDIDVQEVRRRDVGEVSCEHLAQVWPVGESARGLQYQQVGPALTLKEVSKY